MRWFRRRVMPPAIEEARAVLDEAQEATDAAQKAAEEYWKVHRPIRAQYSLADQQRLQQRRHK